MEHLADLIDQLLAAETPEARIAAFATRDLDATERELTSAASRLMETGDDDAETMSALESLADAVDAVRAERARRDGEASAHATQLAGIRDRLAGTTATAAAAGPEDEDNPEGGDDTGDGDGTAPEVLAAEVPAPVEAPAPVVVAAAAPARPSLGALRALAPESAEPIVEPARPVVSVSAALDVPGFSVGSSYGEIRDIAFAMIARQEALGSARGGGVANEKVPVARFSYADSLRMLTEDGVMNGLMLMEATKDNALTASGGSCAPKENVYDFVKINVPTGLAQDFLPTVGAPRGSVQYPASPDIRDAFTANPSRQYSNANDVASVAKGVTTVSCPTFNTCTVGAQYVILKFGNFATRAYPEWVQHWIGLSMDVHAHQVSNKLIGQMIALSNASVSVGPNGGATGTLFGNMIMAAADYRSDLRMADDANLEVMLPIWVDDLIRSDLAKARKGGLETLAVTDQQIASWFAVNNLTPRYVTDWQNVSGNAATGTTVWPSGLSFLLYAPGTFIKLDMGTLDLGVVRDSVLNTTNDYHIFVETFESVCKPGIESRLYSVSVCANGAFSADQNLNCAGIDIPES